MDSFKKYLSALDSTIADIPNNFSLLEEAASLINDANQVVCIGVGKSGFVARKLNASLISISVNSIYLHPSEALHGDVGLVTSGALAVVFSKSGNSSEINSLLPFLKSRNCEIIAICNKRQSNLGNHATVFIDTHVEDEGEQMNTLPLISVDISMILGNLIVSRVSEMSEITLDKFAKNHPGGQLGRNISLRLCDLVEWKKRKPFIPADTSILDAIALDSEHKTGLVCVVDSGAKLIGIVTDGDIRRAIRDNVDLKNQKVTAIMTEQPVTLKENDLVGQALDRMEKEGHRVFSAPIVDTDQNCVGVATLHDLIA